MIDLKDDMIGKKINVFLKTGRKYSGKIKSIDKDMYTIIDKFGEIVIFSLSEISSLEVQNNHKKEFTTDEKSTL